MLGRALWGGAEFNGRRTAALTSRDWGVEGRRVPSNLESKVSFLGCFLPSFISAGIFSLSAKLINGL